MGQMTRTYGVVLLLAVVVCTGCQSTIRSDQVKGAQAVGEDKLVPGDIISIKIQGVPDPPSFEGSIDEKGYIEMLYFGRFKAEGYTQAELQERIKYLSIEKQIYPVERVTRDMLVTVLVGTRFYYITGEAAKGRYPLVGPLTVYKALLSTGGVGEFANMKKVIVHRGGKRILVNCMRAGTDAKYDLPVKAGDVIEVPKKGLLPFL